MISRDLTEGTSKTGHRRPHGRRRLARGTRSASVCLLFLALLAMSCSTGGGEAPDPPDKVRAVVLPILFTAPFHIAAAEGYFADENLDVEFVRLTRNIDAIPALAQGDVDVGAGQLTVAMINAMLGGAHIRVVGDTGHLAADACSFAGVVVRADLLRDGGIEDAAQLRGRRLEMDPALPHAYWLDLALRGVGLTSDDLQTVNVPSAATVDAFLNDAFDITAVTEPRVTQMVRDGQGALWMGVEDLTPGYPQSVVFYGTSLLDERPEVGERFMTAFLRAVRQYNQGKTARNLEILSAAMRLTEEELIEACWVSIGDDGHVPAEPLVGYQEWAAARGLVDGVLTEDAMLETRFVDAANRRLQR